MSGYAINPQYRNSIYSAASSTVGGSASPANASRFSLASTGTATGSTVFPAGSSSGAANYAAVAKSKSAIYDRNLNKSRTNTVSLSAYAFLFSQLIQYTQKRVTGIDDLERRLNMIGYRVGLRVSELLAWRNEGGSKVPKREIRLLPALMYLHTQVWKAVFGKTADAIEKSVEHDDEYMIIDNDPPITRSISVPRDMSSLSCSALTAGIVEAVLDGLGFAARVTAHAMPTEQYPGRTTILIKLDRSVLEREDALK